MRLSSVTNAATWRGLALEARALRPPPDARSSGPLSWPLPDDIRERARLHWPQTYDWEHAGEWVDSLLDGFREHVDVQYDDLRQPFRRVVLASLTFDGIAKTIAIDYSDYPELDEACVADADVYFKLQHSSSGYDVDRVVPGGFVARGRELYRYLPLLRRLRDRKAFHHEVYGAFSSSYARDVRGHALAELEGQDAFRFDGGTYLLRYSAYLQNIARSMVCVDLPGNGPFCFRLVEYLAVGACIVGPEHAARLHVPLVDGQHLAYVAHDLSDLVPTAAALVADVDRRERLARDAREFFDLYLHPRQLAAYYLHTAIA
jgi:hypothetical protein